MSRDEFITHALAEADQLRQGILADDDADAALVNLAGNEAAWQAMYLSYLAESGRLRAEDAIPPTRRDQELASLMATLAGGVLRGPGGDQIILSGEFGDFFDTVRRWYGHDPTLTAPNDTTGAGFTGDSLSFFGILSGANPVPELPTFDDYDLGLDLNTHFQTMRVYVPWVPFDKRGAGIPADYQIRGITPNDEDVFFPLNLQEYYDQEGSNVGAVSQTGPFTLETGGFVPINEPLPFTINFQNDPNTTRDANEVRVVVPLDENMDPRSFQLGDIKVGDITIRIPGGRALYQGDFEFAETLGFNVRVSAGIDVKSNAATWLIQAIDPLTGELRSDTDGGLLPPNNAQGQGAGFVTYSIEVADSAETGDVLTAKARVLLDNAPPEDADDLVYEIDAQAPASDVTVTPLNDENDFIVSWDVEDDADGSGFKHVTLYVAEDGGDYKIWQRQLAQAGGEEVFIGRVGHTYEFLALATDQAGNRETPPAGATADDDGTTTSLGALPTVDSTPGMGVVVGGTIPYKPETLAKRDENKKNWIDRDPEVKCFLPGVPRATYLPHPFQIFQNEQSIYIVYQFANATREIFMQDPGEAPIDSWMGWSHGTWDGDTLVIEVTGQLADTWFDRSGNFHSSTMKVTERYTPISDFHLMYEATIEDDETFTRPWTIRMPLYRRMEDNAQLMDFRCVEFVEELMVGEWRKEPLPR